MADYDGNNDYIMKLLLGTIIGVIIVLFLVPLGANIIATQEVSNAANNVLNSLDTSQDVSSLAIPVDTSGFDIDDTPTVNSKTNPKNNIDDNNTNKNTVEDNTPTDSKINVNNMKILSGSITTGSGLNDKSVCKVYVGKEYSGADIKISTTYSRDGTDLNAGNVIAKTVDSSGYVTLRAADSYDLYPDKCLIIIFDSDEHELDYKNVPLAIESGTQNF